MPLPPAESTACHCCTACGRDNTLEPNNYIKVMERRNVLPISAGVQQQPAERTPHMDDNRAERKFKKRKKPTCWGCLWIFNFHYTKLRPTYLWSYRVWKKTLRLVRAY